MSGDDWEPYRARWRHADSMNRVKINTYISKHFSWHPSTVLLVEEMGQSLPYSIYPKNSLHFLLIHTQILFQHKPHNHIQPPFFDHPKPKNIDCNRAVAIFPQTRLKSLCFAYANYGLVTLLFEM